MTEQNKELALVNESDSNEIATVPATATISLASTFEGTGSDFYCSIVDDGSREAKVKIYNAMQNVTGKLADIKKPIHVQDLIAHNITIADEVTGEMTDTTRIVLVTPEGEGYEAVSGGVISSIQKITAIVGRAPWYPAIKIMPVEKRTRKGFKTLTLELVL